MIRIELSMQRNSYRCEILRNDDYWMGVALMIASSPSSVFNEGCVILDSNNCMLGVGFDSLPVGLSDSYTKADHIVHAEMNAIANCKSSIFNGTVYITYTPCYNCLLTLVTVKVRKVVYFSTGQLDIESKDLVDKVGLKIEEFKGNLNWIRDYIQSLDVF